MKMKPDLKIALVVLSMTVFFPVMILAQTFQKRTITDMAGRRVILNGSINRIVTTFKPASLCVLSLGLAHKMVGIDTSFGRDRLARAVFPEIADITGIGTKSLGIHFETLIALKPDLVILYSQKDGIELADRLSAMNIACIVIIPETYETILACLRLIAEATGEQNRVLPIEKHMEQILNLVSSRVSGLSDQEKKTAYFASSLGLFNTTTANMLQHDIMTRAGIINVSGNLKGYFQDISPEQLVKWNPDMILLSQHINRSEPERLSNPALKQIKAVSQNFIFRCPSSLSPWDFPSPLSVLATLWVAKKAYPKRFSDIDMTRQADDFHKCLFGKTMTQMGGNINDSTGI